MKSLLLDRTTWDLVLDASGNLAVCTEPYAIAQDVATAARTFAGEVWYDTTQGLPYFDLVLGEAPPVMLLKALYVDAALEVPGVVTAQCFFSNFVNRKLTGQIQLTDDTGTTQVVAF